ncbi:hypothetical protein K1W54_09150 [Micromonospora sp. CPCC 205371]|nr:hypothetical protein [Micromonospora sp. CPCC 205371]
MLAAAGVCVATPAAAAPEQKTNDLAIKVTGTTIAANQTVKVGKALMSSDGPDATDWAWWTFDLTQLDTSKVELRVKRPEDEPCLGTSTKLDCPYGWRVATGYEVDQPFELRPIGDATGDAGTLTVSVWHDPKYGFVDPNPSDNSTTVAVTIAADSGPNLNVSAGGDRWVYVGEETGLAFQVQNDGDQPVAGVRATVKLPKHVTFPAHGRLAACRYSADSRAATCTYPNLPMIPLAEDKQCNDDIYSGYNLPPMRIFLDHSAPVGAELKGTVTVEGIAASAERAASLPAGVTGLRAGEIDASDNRDDFVIRTQKRGGAGGGSLPVTGGSIGLVTAIGGGALVVGACLTLLNRRRKVTFSSR